MRGQQASALRPRGISLLKSRTVALGLLSLMILFGCSTPSANPVAPVWSRAECPPPQVQLDRSFAAPFPDCVDELLEAKKKAGSWLGRAIDQAEADALNKTCLTQLAAWRDAEAVARKIGAPGT